MSLLLLSPPHTAEDFLQGRGCSSLSSTVPSCPALRCYMGTQSTSVFLETDTVLFQGKAWGRVSKTRHLGIMNMFSLCWNLSPLSNILSVVTMGVCADPPTSVGEGQGLRRNRVDPSPARSLHVALDWCSTSLCRSSFICKMKLIVPTSQG